MSIAQPVAKYGQNLLNSNFLGNFLVNSMCLKLFSYVNYFWNSSLANSSLTNLRSNQYSLTWNLKKKKKKQTNKHLELKFQTVKINSQNTNTLFLCMLCFLFNQSQCFKFQKGWALIICFLTNESKCRLNLNQCFKFQQA